MKALIHFEYADGTEDSIVLAGDTANEIRQQADRQLEIRGGLHPWSEIIEE